MNSTKTILGLSVAAAALAGCTAPVDMAEVESVGKPMPTKFSYTPSAPAGLPITRTDDATKFPQLVAANAARWGASRPDPFALTVAERGIDNQQAAERLLASTGGFGTYFEPPEDASMAAISAVPFETQPYRRLSGIIVGDSVIAILEMGDGRTEIIRPGQQIPNSPWKVALIDEEKAVLTRTGNVEPKRVVVRLESPPGGVATTPSMGGGVRPGGGMPPGFGGPGMQGFPGMPGAGRPGTGGKPAGGMSPGL